MGYNITLTDKHKREASIQERIDASKITEVFYDFRNTEIHLPVIRVPIDILIYRMENFRTFSLQSEYLARENKSPTFFKTGQENESVQQIQHDLLAKLASKGISDSVIPVIDVLSREKQRDSLLITSAGVVVNGNRRLAAMRELYEKDKVSFGEFSHVNCKVLPRDATPNEILDIEGILQARPETRLDYDWIGDAELVKAMFKAKGTTADVARILNRKESEVKSTLQALSEAEIYLKDWVNAEGEYGRVLDSGAQLFKDLPSLLSGKRSHLQDASRAIAWTLFENVQKLNDRLYAYNITFGKRAEDVLNQLGEALDISLDEEKTPSQKSDLFEFDLEEESTTVNYTKLVEALKNENSKKEAIETLVDICTNVVESEKDQKSESAALKSVSAANAKLAEVDLTRAGSGTYKSISKQLESIINRANSLKSQIEQMIQTSGKRDND